MAEPFSFTPKPMRMAMRMLPVGDIEDRRAAPTRGNRSLRDAAAMSEQSWDEGDNRMLLHPLHLAFPGPSEFSGDIENAAKSTEMMTTLQNMRREAENRARLAAWNSTGDMRVVRPSPLLEQLHGEAPESALEMMFGSLAPQRGR